MTSGALLWAAPGRTRTHRLRDAAGGAAVWLAPMLVTAVFLWLLGDIVWHGARQLSPAFLFTDPIDAGRAGGIAPMLVSTLLLLAVCLAVAVPIGFGTALLLAELTRRGGWFGATVRRSLDVLAGVPSIVFGLFGNAFFCVVLGFGFSILAGGLTLACMVLPILIRSAEAGIRGVPDEHRLGAAALGFSRVSTAFRVLLPAAMPALVIGLVLGIGRALAETAALIFTSGYVTRMPTSLFDSGRSLSVHILDLALNVPGGDTSAYATALVLVVALLALDGAVFWISAYRLTGGTPQR
ncbi:MAG TPA: phosphate ABC transporter permease PstA [Gemmatimonadales bacterium]|nr:phosphate ABC transporter permease PstA [Gemmatimonadales bacterium]